jgi:hypothetical protein
VIEVEDASVAPTPTEIESPVTIEDQAEQNA